MNAAPETGPTGRARGAAHRDAPQIVDRRVEHGRVTRQRLIAVGRELFGAHGYDGTSIGAILAGAGVARGALYYHFETKEALFDAVLTQVVSETAAAAREAALRESDPAEQIRASCRFWLHTALDPEVQRIALLDPPAVVGWTRWRVLDEQYLLGGLRETLGELVESGRFPSVDLDLLAHMILAAVSEAALFIAGADDPAAALVTGEHEVMLLLDRLLRA